MSIGKQEKGGKKAMILKEIELKSAIGVTTKNQMMVVQMVKGLLKGKGKFIIMEFNIVKECNGQGAALK